MPYVFEQRLKMESPNQAGEFRPYGELDWQSAEFGPVMRDVRKTQSNLNQSHVFWWASLYPFTGGE